MYKILIIEDDLTMAQAIQKEMKMWGNDAQYVQDFKNVLETFAEFDPHLVLMDITLPFYNGYHWCSEIRKISNVPVIFISSAADNMNIIMAVNMGGDDFVPKPFDLSVLTAKVQSVLRRTYDLSGKVPVLEHQGAILNLNDASLTYNGEKIEPGRDCLCFTIGTNWKKPACTAATATCARQDTMWCLEWETPRQR